MGQALVVRKPGISAKGKGVGCNRAEELSLARQGNIRFGRIYRSLEARSGGNTNGLARRQPIQ